MERFAADLHVHSRFSRATSKDLSIRSLAAWGRVKGITVLGTGDFTHPGWLQEIEDTLQEDGSGLLVLKDPANLEALVPGLPALPPGQTRFMLQAEISSIYKKAGKVRKIHNLVYLPSLEAVRAFNQKLGQVGNLKSDGRPILGLDSRNLLEMVLSTHPQGFVIPAHIWTPWFSLFGSKSGFNSIEACFEDLSGEIFAMETGLSSDPEMNWLWSALDRIRLVSNSDAHSGEKLGRECNQFRGEISYEGIYRALRGEGLGQKFLGTVEFFPEEGKYHLDGHRKCNVVMEPEETSQRRGICPVCGKPVTLGVLSRVRELADRKEPLQPQTAPGFTSLIPLKELLGEVLDAGPATKKVHDLYLKLLRDFGTELNVLTKATPEDLKPLSPVLAEGVARMREGKVLRTPGYDGEYGVIRVFSEAERREFRHGGRLVQTPAKKRKTRDLPEAPAADAPLEAAPDLEFNLAQKQAITAG
ncbi:MAG TPA: DNA helicase UvrD, partial [Desulfovibrio sp.]|nr:DNA helicase UvrD [Desulfovibrio sp.]